MILFAFKLGFLQLICKAFLIFKWNLELALSIILKQRELYESKHIALECRCLKIWDLLSFLICCSIHVSIYQFVKDSFVATSITVINNSNIYQKNSVSPKTFNVHSFLLLTSSSLQNLTSHNKKSLQKSLYTQ